MMVVCRSRPGTLIVDQRLFNKTAHKGGSVMEKRAMKEKKDTYNEADLLRFLDEFMGRRAKSGGDTVLLDSHQTIAAIGLFFVKVGWVLRLDQNRYIHLPTDAASVRESASAESGTNNSNCAFMYRKRKSRRPRRQSKR
jgi:hypothetical protein